MFLQNKHKTLEKCLQCYNCPKFSSTYKICYVPHHHYLICPNNSYQLQPDCLIVRIRLSNTTNINKQINHKIQRRELLTSLNSCILPHYLCIFMCVGMGEGQQTRLGVIRTPSTSFETKSLIGQELTNYARSAASQRAWHSYIDSGN